MTPPHLNNCHQKEKAGCCIITGGWLVDYLGLQDDNIGEEQKHPTVLEIFSH